MGLTTTTGGMELKMDLLKASKILSDLDLRITIDNLFIDVLWFRVMQVSNPENWSISRHKHSTYEFHFIASGDCKVILDNDEFTVSAGEFYLTAPGVYHEQRSYSRTGFVEYCINCDLLLQDNQLSEAHKLSGIFTEAPCKAYKDLYGAIASFDMALNEAFQQKVGFYNGIKSLVVMILTSAARAIKENSQYDYPVPYKSSRDDYRFTLIKKFVEDNLSVAVTTGDIAKFMHLSDKQVCRIIENKTGTGTKHFIMQTKLQKAKALLKETNMSLKEISEALGFSSEYYFSQFFKREEGYPPGVFRSNIRY